MTTKISPPASSDYKAVRRSPAKKKCEHWRAARDLRRHLKDFASMVNRCIVAIEVAMAGPSTEARGKRIAAIFNQLDGAHDLARHFGLGEPSAKVTREKLHRRVTIKMLDDITVTCPKCSADVRVPLGVTA